MNPHTSKLPLSQGKFAIIDAEDFKKVGPFKWSALKTPSGNFYAVRNSGGKNSRLIYLHGAVLGVKGVDHKDGNGLDCRKENLRSATPRQQQRAFRRKPSGTSSKFRGVTWYRPTSKWNAQIKDRGSKVYLGYFENEVDAARAFDKRAIKLGFAKEALNFPNE